MIKMYHCYSPEAVQFCKENFLVYFTNKPGVIKNLSDLLKNDAALCSLNQEDGPKPNKKESICLKSNSDGDDKHYLEENKLESRQAFCLQMVQSLCEQRKHVVIIDTESMAPGDLLHYFKLCSQHSYIMVMLTDTSHRSCKGTHPYSAVAPGLEIPQTSYLIPYYYGWFLGQGGSNFVRNEGFHAVNDLLNLEEFLTDTDLNLLDLKEEQPDLRSLYFAEILAGNEIMHHVTACFVNEGKTPWYGSYIRNANPDKAAGKISEIEIIGWFVTPRTIGARIKLSAAQLKLWGKKDSIIKQGRGTCRANAQYGAIAVGASNVAVARAITGRIKTSSTYTSINKQKKLPSSNFEESFSKLTLSVSQPNLGEEKRLGAKYLSPTYDTSCTAHITLGCREGTPAKQTGYDLKDIATCELGNGPVFELARQSKLIRSYGAGRWMCYNETPLKIPVIFSGYYKW